MAKSYVIQGVLRLVQPHPRHPAPSGDDDNEHPPGRNDDGPIAEKVTQSARACAARRAVESARPASARLFEDPFAEALAGREAMQTVTRASASGSAGARSPRIAIRTRWFDDFLTCAVRELRAGDGAATVQVVMLGAGMDMRAFRMRDVMRGVVVYEVDDMSVLRAKRHQLQRLQPAAWLAARAVRDVHAHLGLREWPSLLLRAGFDAGLPTVWVAEGLLYYLLPDAVARLLAAVARLSAPGSCVAFSAVTRPSQAAAGLPMYFRSCMPDPYDTLPPLGLAVRAVDVMGGSRANYGRCLPKDHRADDAWRCGQATIFVAAVKTAAPYAGL